MNRLISFSGIDGSGKTTQINNLLDYYKKQNKKCISYTELPKTEPIDEVLSLKDYYNMIKDFDVLVLRSCYRRQDHVNYLEYIKNESHNVEDTYKLQQFFIRDTYEWFKEVIIPLINENKIIIFDRFVYDELPYQMLFNKDVKMIENLIDILPKPQSFYLKIDVETMKNRNADREDSKNKLFSSDERIKKLLDNYDDVFRKFECTPIEARLDTKAVNRCVMKKLSINNIGEENERM